MSAQSSFYFYDLETSGISPRSSRIMQFAGQRTAMDLQSVGEPDDLLIKLSPDVLPDPDAVLLTGITPQQTLQDGLTEAEFLEHFTKNIATPGTIFVGYNSIRFDDEFMRYLHWRNFYDPYQWQWQDGRGKWDLLDVARMTRALRPEGIKWPMADGKPTVRLEAMTAANGIKHDGAHTALADVRALIDLAKLLRTKQTKLFDYLLAMRDKKKVSDLVLGGQAFVYTSGKYLSEFDKTTAVVTLARHPHKQGALVYDLRHDPTEFLAMSPQQLVERWQWTKEDDAPSRLPVKTLQFNKCPAVAPLGVLTEGDSLQRLHIDLEQIQANQNKLAAAADDFKPKLLAALELLEQQQAAKYSKQAAPADERLYDGFLSDGDCNLLPRVRAAKPAEIAAWADKFSDERLKVMLPLYQARNYPESLTAEQRAWWDQYCQDKLQGGGQASQLARYGQRLAALAAKPNLTKQQQFLLEELQLYAESIISVEI